MATKLLTVEYNTYLFELACLHLIGIVIY